MTFEQRRLDVKSAFESAVLFVSAAAAEDFRAFVASEIDKWGKVVREANIKLG